MADAGHPAPRCIDDRYIAGSAGSGFADIAATVLRLRQTDDIAPHKAGIVRRIGVLMPFDENHP